MMGMENAGRVRCAGMENFVGPAGWLTSRLKRIWTTKERTKKLLMQKELGDKKNNTEFFIHYSLFFITTVHKSINITSFTTSTSFMKNLM